MTTYLRQSDGLEMVLLGPWQWVNRRDGERLGLVARVATPAIAPVAAEPPATPKPKRAEQAKPDAAPDGVPDLDEPMRRYARLLFKIGNTMREVIDATGLSREVAGECRKAAKA